MLCILIHSITHMKKLAIFTFILLLPVLSLAQAPDYSSYILTPPAPDTPLINGPKVYGASPKAEFLYRIPVSGRKPMQFSAKGLPVRQRRLRPDERLVHFLRARILPCQPRRRGIRARRSAGQGLEKPTMATLLNYLFWIIRFR